MEMEKRSLKKPLVPKKNRVMGQDVAATADGGFVVAGSFIEKTNNRTGTRVLKFGADNQLQWDKRFDTGIAFAIRQTRTADIS